MNNVEVLLTGGGTGGHVYPGLALIDDVLKDLQEKYPQKNYDMGAFAWIGSCDGPENFFVKNFGMNFYAVRAGKLRRYFSLQNFIDPINIIIGFFQARNIIRKLCPKVLVSIGGFVSVPSVLAASSCNIPVLSVSCDMSLGLATKIGLPFSTFVSCAYKETAELCKRTPHIVKMFSFQKKKRKKNLSEKNQDELNRLNIAYDDINSWIMGLGNPIRKDVYCGDAYSINKKYNIDKKNIFILFLGGSKGAHQINELVLRILPKFTNNISIMHQTGFMNEDKDYSKMTGLSCQYISMGFITDDYADVLARADVVVARAGAGTLWEIVANKIPSLIIPLSKENSRGDQIENAEYFSEKGMVINVGPNPNDDDVYNTITRLYTDKNVIKNINTACENFGATEVTSIISKYISFFL